MANLVSNNKAWFDYELGEQLEAGLELSGFEVKALKLGRGQLTGARVIVRGGEAYLMGAQIDPYQPANPPSGYVANRAVKLLLTKKEINLLAGVESQKSLTAVPLAIYNKHGRLKLKLALARAKKKYDKRESIKKRETDRELGRTLKGG